jgi:hypothetical protein
MRLNLHHATEGNLAIVGKCEAKFDYVENTLVVYLGDDITLHIDPEKDEAILMAGHLNAIAADKLARRRF